MQKTAAFMNQHRALLTTIVAVMCLSMVGHAQSPWENVANRLASSFTGNIARACTVVAIVVGGIQWMSDDHGSGSKIIGKIVFGGGMAMLATQFLAWLF